MSDEHSVLDITEAAAYLHFKLGYLYQLISKGKIAFSKPNNGKLLFLREDLDSFIRKGRRGPYHEEAERIPLARSSRRKRGAA